jgi:uncharacterized damage-inducible protein DinB
MNAQTSMSRAHLEQAEVMLRDVLAHDFAEESGGDSGSLGRMLVHIVNIQRAVSTSTDAHANAAKRLVDFAETTTRMTARKPESAQRLGKLADTLRAASSGLHESLAAEEAAQSRASDAAPGTPATPSAD